MLTLRLLLGLLLVCGVAMSSHGQSMLQQKVDDVRASAPSVSHSLLSRVASVSAAHTGSLHYAEHYELSEIALSAMISSPQEALEIVVPYRGKSYELQLVPNHLRTVGYEVKLPHGGAWTQSKNYYYHGTITGQEGWATLAIMGDKVRLLIAHSHGNIEIIPHADYYIGYQTTDIKTPKSYTCGVEHDAKHIKSTTSDSRAAADCLELYIEADYQSYLDNGSSVAQTEAWALSIMNDVSTIYGTIGISLSVSGLLVRTASGPYASSTNKTELRTAFVDELQGNYEGRVALLFSTRDLQGGLAYGIGGYCADYPSFPGPFAVATSMSSTLTPYPSYSFNVQVVAHELGHVLGARHTHACVWNDNDTQIDDCGNVWATNNDFTPEGATCYDEEAPILPASGTVMSYCDLVTGVGIDLANGFNPEVGTLLATNFQNALCSTGGVCATVPPSNDECAAAIVLPNRQFCVLQTFDHVLASASGPASVSCATLSNYGDVWFSYVAAGSLARIQVIPADANASTVVVTYTGSCGALTEAGCASSNGAQGITVVGPSASEGELVYVRIIANGGTAGSFDICVNDPTAECHPYADELTELYDSAGGAQWTNSSGWASTISSSNCDVCQWYGVTCDNNGNIIEIDLSFNNLNGSLPSSLGSIATLRKFDVFSNNLSGLMPNIWSGMLDMEYLDLSANTFTGLIPRSIMDLPLLHTVYFENNQLQDTLPKELGLLPNIDVLWLKNNQLTGCFPATFVNICDISSKNFTGNNDLPGGGDIIAYCADGTGNDADFDGYCKGQGVDDDCDDDDRTVYPSAPELCDGKDNDCDGDTDEQLVSSNTWLGGTSSWHNAANWSTGEVPRACEDVIVNGGLVTLQAGAVGYARSVLLTGASTLLVQDTLHVTGSDDFGISVLGQCYLENTATVIIENVDQVGMNIDGQAYNTGSIFVQNKSVAAEVIVGDGSFVNDNGTITLE